MSPSQSVMVPQRGRFIQIYRHLSREKLLDETLIVFCEGDSWFSTPLAMNILDWLVYPTPEENEAGVPIIGKGGLFFRAEHSGDEALDMFTRKKVSQLARWFAAHDFDLVLLSAGGNDFVGGYLEKLFDNAPQMSVEDAFQRIVDDGRYEAVLAAYRRLLDRFTTEKPNVPIIGHTYCYPIRLGVPATLTLKNLGIAAIFKKKVGGWISKHIKTALPDLGDQRAFTKKLIDGFVTRVLDPLAHQYPTFTFVDLRTKLPDESDWYDEMHPTDEGFRKLSREMRIEIAKHI